MLLKKLAKIIRENTFQQKKKKPGLKFNPGLALIGLRTTGSCSFSHCSNLAFRLFYTKLIQLNSRLGTPIFNGQFDSFVPRKTHIFSKISPLNVTGSDNSYNGHFSVS